MDNHQYGGGRLTMDQFRNLFSGHLNLSTEVWDKVAANRNTLEELLKNKDRKYYGINTGFGSLYKITISPEDTRQLQTNLLRSHACGVGMAAPAQIVRLTLLLKIISLVQACSGVRKEIIEFLLALYNQQITPVVPMTGSLGASGDLAPLAHLCLPLIGEGEVVYKREQMPAQRALATAGLQPLELEAKEGLALINGTQYSLAWLLYAIENASRISACADMCAALSMDAFDCQSSPLDMEIHRQRNQIGQIAAASNMTKWLDGSGLLVQTKEHLQDPYSFRCAPQVHGASRDVIGYVTGIAENEINAVTDNPLVFSEKGDARVVSGGNFHAQPLALSSDFLAIAVAELGSISERRGFLLLSGQRGLPPALAVRPGLESGMMICQYTAAAIVNRNKILSHPASTDTIVTSAGQEDHVSMAATSGIKLFEVVNNVWKILAIEWMLAAQAMEARRPGKTSQQLEEKLAAYRQRVAPLAGDRSLTEDIDVTEHFLRQIDF